jgi:hypothetical protein
VCVSNSSRSRRCCATEVADPSTQAKILPLRLHVDQDALDFLKRFFAFRDPKGATAPAAGDAGAGSSKEVYLRAHHSPPCMAEPGGNADCRVSLRAEHVEIFPIQLKLDYKPKRVDYRGLRDGRTIELMNFFHFDGAEMTLRRITLSGVRRSRSLITLCAARLSTNAPIASSCRCLAGRASSIR